MSFNMPMSMPSSTIQPQATSCAGSSSTRSSQLAHRRSAVPFGTSGSLYGRLNVPITRRRLGAAGCRALNSSASAGCVVRHSCRRAGLYGRAAAVQGIGGRYVNSSSSAARSDSHITCAQRRRLFGGEGGSTPGSTSGSSSDDDTPVPQIPPQQLRAQQTAAAEAERQRKRQDALRRIEASAARLARKRGTGSATIDSALQQIYARELAADAADIVASSPSTLKQQLAQEGADLEADWAEAEASSAAALTTTGRAKTLAALAASKGLSPTDVLRPTRPTLRPELPFPEDDSDFYDDDDDDAWQEILDSDDLPLWEDSRYSGLLAGKDPVAAAAASIRRQIDDPAFQAWLRQQEQQRDAKAARARREADLQAKLQAGKSAAERIRRQQDAADLAKMQSKLQQQQQQQGMTRPLMRPNAPAGGNGSGGVGGFEEDVITDPNNIRRSDVGLTPAEMALLFEEFGADTDSNSSSSSSSSRQKLQAAVFTPKEGYSFSDKGRAAASRLADAGASGQLQRPLLVRPSVRPIGTAGSSILDNQYWDAEEASAAAAAQEAAERTAFIQSLLAEQQQQQQQEQRRPQQGAGPAIDADRLAVAAENVKKAVVNAQLKRPARPGAAAAAGQSQSPAKPLLGLAAAAGRAQQPGDRFAAAAAAAAASLQRPASQAQQQQEQQAAAAAWDAEEAAAAAVAQQEADRLALLEQLQAEADAADLIAFAVAAAEPKPAKKATPKVIPPSSSSSGGGSSTVAAKPGLQGVKRPAQRPQQQQRRQQEPMQSSKVGRKLSPAQLQAAKPQQQQQQQQPLKQPKRPHAPAAVAAEQREEDLATAWDAVEAAEATVAQADAARRALLQQLAAEAQAAEEAAAAAAAAAAGSGSSKAAAKAGSKGSSSKQGALQVPDVSQKTLEAFSGLKKPPARPAAAAAAAAPSVPRKKGAAKQQQQQQQEGKQATEQQADKHKQQDKGSQPGQAAAAKKASAQSAAETAAAAAAESGQLLLSPEDLQLVDQAAKGSLRNAGKQAQQQQQQQQQQQSGSSDADKAALKQRLEQAAQALQKEAAPAQLQRPVRPAPAAAAAAKGPRRQPTTSSSSSSQGSAAQSAGAVDWRFAEAAAASSSSGSSAGSGRLAGVRREGLPRTIPEHKLQLAKYLEVTRTPTTAVVIGTAAKANGYLSLIVQLEELECVTLMPVSQLLPSQLVQLCDEMQTGVPRFLYEGKPLRNQGYLGQQAVAALKDWKGRKLDVIVSTMRQPDYATFAARERPAAGATPFRRYSRLFWLRLTRSCQMVVADRLTGADELSSDVAAMLSGTDSIDRQKDIAAFVKDFISLDASATADKGVSIFRPYLLKSPVALERDVTGAVYQVELADSVALSLRDCLSSSNVVGQAAATLLGANADHAADPSLVVKLFRELLMQLQAQQLVSEEAASILFQPEDSSGAKYARCVAVAAWPPAWLDQELTNSSSSSSDSGSNSVLYVTDRELLMRRPRAAESSSPGFTWPQALLWRLAVQYRRREGIEPPEDRTFDAQVVGVHSKGYLLCQVMHQPDTRKATTLEELTEPTIAAATVAVPLSECPPSLRLQVSQQQQQQGKIAGDGGSAGLSLYQEQQQPRWEPWELQQSAAAAAGTIANSVTQQGLQAWRQGVLGLWRQPYLKVKLQLLPLEQQQDVAALEAMQAEVADWVHDNEQFIERFDTENYDFGRASEEDFEDRGPPQHSSFGDTLNMLLLGRIVEDTAEA